MSRKVETRPPSFPAAEFDKAIANEPGIRWQVLCGDENHWRVGIYSPPESSPDEIEEYELHDCPEFFLLLEGRVSLALAENGNREIVELEAGKPVLVTSPHSGFCPGGPHTGTALVVERDSFDTEYRRLEEW